MYKSVSISNIMIIRTNLSSGGGGHYFIDTVYRIILIVTTIDRATRIMHSLAIKLSPFPPVGGGGQGVTSAWSPLGNFLEGQAHPNPSSNQVFLFF